ITAVWSSMARLNASAQVPSSKTTTTKTKDDKENDPAVLHVRVSDKDKKFILQWQKGTKTEDYTSVEMQEEGGRYPKLEEEMKKAYQVGQQSQNLYGDDPSWDNAAAADHGANALNQAILHVDNAFAFKEVVRVIDAIYGPRRYVCFDSKPNCCG